MSQPELELLLPGDPDTLTGGYAYDRRIAAGLRELGWRVDVHSLDASFPAPTPAALRAAQELLARLPAGALVLVDGLALGAMPALAEAHAGRLRLLALVHHPLAAETGLPAEQAASLFASEQRALAAARAVIVTSSATATALAAYGVDARRLHVVQPGVEQRRRVPRIAAATTVPRLLCVGTLTPRKGHAILIEALSRLAHLPWTLDCIGSVARDPATARDIEARIVRAGLQERVRLLGEVGDDEAERHRESAHLFVLASLYEGYGMAVAEALASGLPVVATRTGGIGGILPPEAGVVVEPGNAAALAAALAGLLAHPSGLAALSAGAVRAAAQLPDWATCSRRMARILAAQRSTAGAVRAARRP